MPKKKTSKQPKKQSPKRDILSNSDSYKSLFYGIATVIVLFILGFSAVKIFITRPKPEIDQEAVSVSKIEEAMKQTQDNTYTVQEGDSLWSIAQLKYNDGYKWTQIAAANKLSDPSEIEQGTKLIVPVISETPTPEITPSEVMQVSPTPEQQQGEAQEMQAVTSQSEKITGNSYVIHPGDDLWNIAVRAYGDGYKWVDIANANHLGNPDLIHSDNILTIPR